MNRNSCTRITILVVASLIIAGCRGARSENDTATSGNEKADEVATYVVFGALKKMFHEGDIAEQVKLNSLLPSKNLFALGALSDLRGEVTIVGGQAYLSYPDGQEEVRTQRTETSEEGAALLVAAEIAVWRSAKTASDLPFDDLEQAVAALAKQVGIDPSTPFFFRLEGPVEQLQLHVIDGNRLTAGGSSHEDHLKAAVKQRFQTCDATLLGFYSRKHHGILTHMGSDSHIHGIIDAPLVSGHVDHVEIPAGTTIYLANVQLARN